MPNIFLVDVLSIIGALSTAFLLIVVPFLFFVSLSHTLRSIIYNFVYIIAYRFPGYKNRFLIRVANSDFALVDRVLASDAAQAILVIVFAGSSMVLAIMVANSENLHLSIWKSLVAFIVLLCTYPTMFRIVFNAIKRALPKVGGGKD
ncbi:hypothetical protein [Amorphus sp. 3PC139-8]|uniref:hypothetical protein n=1 Tax=Amorphus sp. 3PC139-8 TaxID=2735676 RepID=UPI00345DB181